MKNECVVTLGYEEMEVILMSMRRVYDDGGDWADDDDIKGFFIGLYNKMNKAYGEIEIDKTHTFDEIMGDDLPW